MRAAVTNSLECRHELIGFIRLRRLVSFAIILWCTAASSSFAERERIPVLRGFVTEKPVANPDRIDSRDERMYMIELAVVPMDRMAVRDARILYVDQVPNGGELFRDDLEAMQYMLYTGGIIILMAGPDANDSTVTAFNYLGKRWGFSFLNEKRPPQIVPRQVGKGPFFGDVWLCSRGTRPLTLEGEGWVTLYHPQDSAEPAVAARKMREGLLIVMGTNEVVGQIGNRTHTAITLIDWAVDSLRSFESMMPLPSAVTSPTPAVEGTVNVASNQPEVETVQLSAPPIQARIAELRDHHASRLLTREDPRRVLLPIDKRNYAPTMPMSSQDVDGRAFAASDISGTVALYYFWATWDSASVKTLEQIREAEERFGSVGLQVVGISLDRSVDTVRTFRDDKGLGWRLLCDEKGWSSGFVTAFNVKKLPSVMLVDKNGRIALVDMYGQALERAIAEALEE